ncbi:MAG: hypothetical protein COU08_00950 [Candidatus Harrisonbacteria bacterium CG10_big_fil_rev_8_21_14_0_10_42_17]|uniref:TraC-like domain-containing protein n=1 Tax=Candidatus Harrisonbacteria bacterium CG10_big_fil_rev_8_21_14_0_10_42_17 TaxID=1974584 RepID=A0A2M6WIW7_9BACT|nr:MAG: hypothetical protein COU08_00950 [Candidatus Harrisonbacteria bacterium CG10_big_fil_rev_8_21_14_0_10_42_17]
MASLKGAISAQKFIDIKDIYNNTLIMKSGSLRKVIMVTGTNFGMKSNDEQEIILNTFQGFLNAISFTLQIFVHSRKLNIEAYIERMLKRLEIESNELLRNQITEYCEFIRSFVEDNAIMSKSYFVVVPFDAAPISVASTKAKPSNPLTGFLSRFTKKEPVVDHGVAEGPDEQQRAAFRKLDEKIEQLEQRVSQVVSGLNQIGLRAVPLNNEEIVELFYNLYNPESVEKATLSIAQEHQSTS